jgi:universal stress protein A
MQGFAVEMRLTQRKHGIMALLNNRNYRATTVIDLGEVSAVTATEYEHILLAVDFSPGTERSARRAVELARRYGARLSLIHVVEYLPTALDAELMLPPMAGVDEQLMENARKELAQLAESLGENEATRYVELGSTKLEILRVAEANKVDLIVVGSHGRHGLAHMLGSTASAVLHGAHCDVLAMRTAD